MGQFLDGATARALRAKVGGAIKRLRRDLLTSVAAVAQLAETWRPDALIGIGQGALVALAWARARALEAALTSKTVVDPAECHRIALAWGRASFVALSAPSLFTGSGDPGPVFEALPELCLSETHAGVRPLPVFLLEQGDHPHLAFERAFVDRLTACGSPPLVAATPEDAMIEEVFGRGCRADAGALAAKGRCLSGRASPVLSRCAL